MDGEDNKKHPRDVGELVSKKAKCSEDPCCDIGQLSERKEAVDKETGQALYAARVATHRSHVNRLAKYVELRSIAKKLIKDETQSKAAVDEAFRFLGEVEMDLLIRICGELEIQQNIQVGSVSEIKGVHYMMTCLGWRGKAVIFFDEYDGGIDSPAVQAVRDAAKDLNVTLRFAAHSV